MADAFTIGDKVIFRDPDDVPHRALEWKISSIWNPHCEGLRAELRRPDKTKRRGFDACSAQLNELERVK